MVSPTVIWTPKARNDLTLIYDFLSTERSPETADLVIARIYEAIDRAAAHPHWYAGRTSYPHDIHRINGANHAVIYKPLPGDEGIAVLRIIQGSRDIPRRLGDQRDAA